MKRHTAAHRASTQLFTPLLQVVCGECLKEWGKFTEMKKPAPLAPHSAQQKGPECEIPHLTRRNWLA